MINVVLSDLIYQHKTKKVEFAKYLDVTRATLDSYLNATTPMPSDKIVLAAAYFDVTVGYLFGETVSSTSLKILQRQVADLTEKVEFLANNLQMK